MNELTNYMFESFEYSINKKIKCLNSYDDVYFFIQECITELEMFEYESNLNHITKNSIIYYLQTIKKINIDKIRENLSSKHIISILQYCSCVQFIKEHIKNNILFNELLEYYYMAHIYFYKNVFIKCLKIYLYDLKN
jgi:hypothetical protein